MGFVAKFEQKVKEAVEGKFPSLKDVSVDMDDSGMCHVVYETEGSNVTDEQVQEFLKTFKYIP